MAPYSSPFSVMLLLCVFLSLFHLSTSHPHGHHHFHPALAGRELPTPTIKNPVPAKDIVVASPVSPCVNSNCATALPPPEHLSCYAANSTTFIDNGDNYTLICDIDFPDQNIYPFILAGSFDDCLAQCETYNHKNVPGSRCAGFVFAPERIKDADEQSPSSNYPLGRCNCCHAYFDLYNSTQIRPYTSLQACKLILEPCC